MTMKQSDEFAAQREKWAVQKLIDMAKLEIMMATGGIDFTGGRIKTPEGARD